MTPAEAALEVTAWNRRCPPGTSVIYEGRPYRTAGKAWGEGDGAVVQVWVDEPIRLLKVPVKDVRPERVSRR